MLIVETIAKIRRAFFVQSKSIKAICRELRVLTESRTKGYPIGSDRVPLRARDATASKDWPVAGQTRSNIVGE